jgi:hypothetical protein
MVTLSNSFDLSNLNLMCDEDVKKYNDIQDQIRVERSRMKRDPAIMNSPAAIERLTELREEGSKLLLLPDRLLTVQLRASTIDSLKEFSWYTVASSITGNNRT